jgi:hypothetical protein
MDWNWKGVLQAANQYGMNGYKPGTPQAPQGYVPYEATLNQRGLSNNMQPDNSVIPGTTYQPDNFGNRQPQAVTQMEAEQQAQAQAEQEALQKQQRIEEIEAEIAEIEQRIAERKRGMAANEDALNTQLAAIEARKINQKDPTSIWRWKAQMDENRRIANAQNKSDDTAKANAMIEIANDLDSIIVDDKMTSQDQKAYLSKLSNMKTLGEKAGVPKSVIDNINAKIKEVKGDGGEQTSREKAKTDWNGLKGKPDLTSNEIQTALDNPDMNWDPDERKEAENLRDKLKKHEAATQDVKDMKSWVEKTYGTKWHTLSPRLQETYQRLWKNRKGKK